MKKYSDNQKQKKVKPLYEKSGVACDETKCKGEMMIVQPEQIHPEIKELKRAECGKCSWKGWV